MKGSSKSTAGGSSKDGNLSSSGGTCEGLGTGALIAAATGTAHGSAGAPVGSAAPSADLAIAELPMQATPRGAPADP